MTPGAGLRAARHPARAGRREAGQARRGQEGEPRQEGAPAKKAAGAEGDGRPRRRRRRRRPAKKLALPRTERRVTPGGTSPSRAARGAASRPRPPGWRRPSAPCATREPGGTRIGAVDPRRSCSIRPTASSPIGPRRCSTPPTGPSTSPRWSRPALAAGRHVVSDRSALVVDRVPGLRAGLGVDDVRRLSDWAIEGCWPDLVVLLDIDPAVAGRRRSRATSTASSRWTRRSSERVAAGYLELAAADPHAGSWSTPAGRGRRRRRRAGGRAPIGSGS